MRPPSKPAGKPQTAISPINSGFLPIRAHRRRVTKIAAGTA